MTMSKSTTHLDSGLLICKKRKIVCMCVCLCKHMAQLTGLRNGSYHYLDFITVRHRVVGCVLVFFLNNSDFLTDSDDFNSNPCS